jgi:serine protease Do
MGFKIIKTNSIAVFLTAVMLVLALTACSLPGYSLTSGQEISPAVQTSTLTVKSISEKSNTAGNETVLMLPDFTSIITKVRSSVVSISTEVTGYSRFGRSYTQEGAGSGWIIGGDGLIITNNHVIDGANKVTVVLEDGRTFPAQKISADPAGDLAVIIVDAKYLPALEIGDSSRLLVGEWVVAMGNSLGLGISATKGIVSALNVSLSDSSGDIPGNLIQTDAAINPGNSGGPLLNLSGQVIGINSAKIAQVGVEGMGYAISINESMIIINQLKSKLN